MTRPEAAHIALEEILIDTFSCHAQRDLTKRGYRVHHPSVPPIPWWADFEAGPRGPTVDCEFVQSIKWSIRGTTVPTSFPAGTERPLYEIKANLFKALAHPARIRVLEILSANARPTMVSGQPAANTALAASGSA